MRDTTENGTLEQRAAELRRIIEKPSEKERAAAELADIERQMAERHVGAARERATERLLGIRRAVGSVVASLADDEKRVRETKATYEDSLRRLNDRFGQVNGLKAEADALCHRFQLPVPVLPKVTTPALMGFDPTPRVDLAGHSRRRPHLERCEYGMRERRTYEEVKGSVGYAIIEAAGLMPFPELTERQQQIIEEKKRVAEQERRQVERMAAEVKSVQEVLASIPGPTGIRSM